MLGGGERNKGSDEPTLDPLLLLLSCVSLLCSIYTLQQNAPSVNTMEIWHTK